MLYLFNNQNLQIDNMDKGKILSCSSCGLFKTAEYKKEKPYGSFEKKVMFITEQAGNNHNISLLNRVLNKFSFNLKKDAVLISSILCSTENTDETDKVSLYLNNCRKKVQNIIKEYKPNVIFLLGDTAIESVIGKYYQKDLGTVFKWRGFCIPDQNYNAWICPVFSQSFVKEKGKEGGVSLIWEQDIKRGLDLINQPIPFLNLKERLISKIKYCWTDKEVQQGISAVKKAGYFSFDYETTGLKPYRKGHRIVCTSLCIGDKCFVFENTNKRNKILASLLKTNKVKKSAHNFQFEDTWSSYFISSVNGFDWCSMNTAHILDNRSGITGLKYQVYVNFGVPDYDNEVSNYLKSIDPKVNGANSFNKIDIFIKVHGIQELFEYCALDSIFGYMLTMEQKRILNAKSS